MSSHAILHALLDVYFAVSIQAVNHVAGLRHAENASSLQQLSQIYAVLTMSGVARLELCRVRTDRCQIMLNHEMFSSVSRKSLTIALQICFAQPEVKIRVRPMGTEVECCLSCYLAFLKNCIDNRQFLAQPGGKSFGLPGCPNNTYVSPQRHCLAINFSQSYLTCSSVSRGVVANWHTVKLLSQTQYERLQRMMTEDLTQQLDGGVICPLAG